MEDNIWERLYQQGQNTAMAPYTEIFSFLAKQYGDTAQGKRLLEVGCGVGNNLVFARWAFGFDVYGIDQSLTAIRLARKRFRKHGLTFEFLRQTNMNPLTFKDDYFDVVVDRAAIQHNSFEEAKKAVAEIFRVLKPRGVFYSSLISDNHCLFGRGEDLGNGDYLNEEDGIRHFYSRSEVLELFSSFEVLRWYHTERRELPSNLITSTIYHIEMTKNEN